MFDFIENAWILCPKRQAIVIAVINHFEKDISPMSSICKQE